MSKSKVSRATSVLLTVSTTVWLSGAAMLAPIAVHADTVSDLQAQIAALLAQINTLQSQLSAMQGGGSVTTTACSFTRDLTIGVSGSDVTCLQDYLTSTGHFTFSGGSTGYFGPITQSAVAAWQAANGVSPAVGYFGPISQAKYSQVAGTTSGTGTETGTGTGTTVPSGTGLSVVAASQPSATLAPASATRVPFTKFTLSAGASDVVVNGITVERTGLAADAVFSGLILLDENDVQLGISKTLNSNHQAVIGGTFTVPAGTTKTYTIAGNMQNSGTLGSYGGQIAYVALVGVNTSATVSGSLPITGAGHTINSTLSLGSVTLSRGVLDPATSPTKSVGTTDYVFTAVKVTAGSAEDVSLEQVRFNQSGSVTADDLANVKIYVDGVAYDTTVSSDGKYYTAKFGNGITIGKGLNKNVYIKGDIVSGSGRTVDFDLWKYEDVVVKGKTYGYYITPTTSEALGSSSDDSKFYNTNPRYDASQVTVGNGALVISSSNVVQAGNISNGASGQKLGSFLFDVTGEPISFAGIVLTVATSGATGNITNVTLEDENGSVLAGPQDMSLVAGTVTLSDTVVLPVGKNVLIVKGNLDSNWTTNQTIRLNLNTPASALTTPTGQTTGQSITPTPASITYANTQTISAGALTVSPSSSFASQNVINSGTGVTLGEFVLDASASGEDLQISTIQVRGITGDNADLDELNSLQLFDGATPLNTGGNVLNPSGNAGGADANLTFTIDAGALILAKSTSKVITLKGNVNASSTPTSDTTYVFDFSAGSPDWTVTGVSTGQDISESLTTGSGATLTIVSAGTLTLTEDSSTVTEKWYPAGSSLVDLVTYRLTGTNEPMTLTDFALMLNTSSSSAVDITKLYLYDGTTPIISKTAPFSGSNIVTFTGSSLENFVVPANSYKKLTVKADLAQVGTGQVGVPGHLIKFATTTTASQYKARGSQSGTSVNILGSVGTTTYGARYFKSTPTVEHINTSGVLANGTGKLIYKFKVTADSAGDVSLYKFNFNIATTGDTTVTSVKVQEVGGNTVRSGIAPDANGDVLATVNSSEYGTTEIVVPAGQSKTFEVTGTIANASAGESVTTKLLGDAAYSEIASCTTTCMEANASTAAADANGDFIWSDMSDSSHTTSTADWVNGYKVNGLPTVNLDETLMSL